MSYLDPPRFSFFGTFTATPSTVNNATENYPLTAVYNNNPPSAFNPTSTFWYPQGTAFFMFPSAAVGGAVGTTGPVTSGDAIVGATVQNIDWGGPPAQFGRISDIDPDMQVRSLLVGVRIGIVLAGANTPALSGTMRPANIIDLWGRGVAGGCMYMSVLEDLTWGDLTSSPLLQDLKSMSGEMLSIKFNVDLYDTSEADGPGQFQFGRVAGTIGPYSQGEGIHVLNQRRMWVGSPLINVQNSPLFNAPFKISGSTLHLDLGNSVPATGASPLLQSPFADVGALSLVIDPNGANISIPVYSTVAEYTAQYNTAAGIFDVDLGSHASAATNAPVALAIAPPAPAPAAVDGAVAAQMKIGIATPPQPMSTTGAQIALAENANGMFAAIDFVALRMQNGAPSWASTPDASDATEITGDAEVPVYATQYGQPANVTIDFSISPNSYQWASPTGENPWIINNVPLSAITFPSSVAVTNGVGTAHFIAGPLSTAQKAAADPRRASVDGQLYTFTYSDTMDTGMPLTLLVFEDSPIVENPTWDTDVSPIFTQYARLYPFMRSLIDLSDYSTVAQNAARIKAMINLPKNDPAYMPVTRDLSPRRLDMLNRWFDAKCPQS